MKNINITKKEYVPVQIEAIMIPLGTVLTDSGFYTEADEFWISD